MFISSINTKEKWNKMLANKRHQLIYPSEHVIGAVFKNFPRCGRILDFGCGAGRHTKFLAENGFKTYGCDSSQNGIKATKNLLKLSDLKANLCVAGVDEQVYDDEFFDGILCLGVLYYNDINTISKAVKNIHNMLKKGAKAYVSLRNIDDYRYENAIKITKYDTFIKSENKNASAYVENGIKTYFFDKDEVKRVFADFSEIEINTSRVSFQNDTKFDSFLYVTLTK